MKGLAGLLILSSASRCLRAEDVFLDFLEEELQRVVLNSVPEELGEVVESSLYTLASEGVGEEVAERWGGTSVENQGTKDDSSAMGGDARAMKSLVFERDGG